MFFCSPAPQLEYITIFSSASARETAPESRIAQVHTCIYWPYHGQAARAQPGLQIIISNSLLSFFSSLFFSPPLSIHPSLWFMTVPCLYYPKCPRLSVCKRDMLAHCRAKHNGTHWVACSRCPHLRLFETKKKLSDHVFGVHGHPISCRLCLQRIKPKNYHAHLKKCQERRALEELDLELIDADLPIDDPIAELAFERYKKPPPSCRKGGNLGPVDAHFRSLFISSYVSWCTAPVSLGKPLQEWRPALP
jgi:hypothetical protein